MNNNFDVVRTEDGFSMMIEGELTPIPIGFMRVSEGVKLTKFVKEIVERMVTKCEERMVNNGKSKNNHA